MLKLKIQNSKKYTCCHRLNFVKTMMSVFSFTQKRHRPETVRNGLRTSHVGAFTHRHVQIFFFFLKVSNFLLHTTNFNGQPPNGNSPEIINYPDISVITIIIICRFKDWYLVVAHPNTIGEKIPTSLKRTYILYFSKAHLSNTYGVSLSQNLKITKIKWQPLL